MFERTPENIERMKRKLYGRGGEIPPIRRSDLSGADQWSEGSWEDKKMFSKKPRGRISGWLKFLFWMSLLTFVAVAAVSFWILWSGGNQVSAANVSVSVTGPLSVKAGEKTTLQVEVENKNDAPLEFVDLIIEYPPGTRRAETNEEITRERITLGTILAREKKREALELVFFGEKDGELETRFSAEYRLAGSNAIFDKREIYLVRIDDSPLILRVDAPEEINPGETLALEVEVSSNSETVVEGTVVTLLPPPGFSLVGSEPKALGGVTAWELGPLRGGDKKRIKIFGKLEGQDSDEKVFRVVVGMSNEAGEMGAVFASSLNTVIIRRPLVGLGVNINGSTLAEYVASSREVLKIGVDWQNNLNKEIIDAEILVGLSGQTLDRASVSAKNGFYNSAENSILWHKSTLANLARIAPDASGKAEFTFTSVSLVADNNFRFHNPEIGVRIKFRGKLVGENDLFEVVENELTKNIKLNSVVQLSAKAVYWSSALPTSGPMPPKVGEETVYTIIWSAINSSNDLENVEVRASLPSYIRWAGNHAPSEEQLIFTPGESGGGELVWRVGRLQASSGLATPAREVAFQVGLIPSLSQVGEAPVLVSAPSLTARDTFTGEALTSTKQSLSTYLSFDPLFKFGEDKVQP